MKKLSIIALAVLAGCATARFDNQELSLATELRYMAGQQSSCANTDSAAALAQRMQSRSEFFTLYVEHVPNNTETVQMVAALNNDIQSFSKAYQTDKKPSVAYCKNKLDIIGHSADLVQRSMAIKLRK